MSKKFAAVALAALALIGTASSAFAAPGYATTSVNVRSGPGTHYYAIDTLQRGERVDIQYCQGSWCYVEKSGPDGWVSASYIDRGRPDRPRWDRPRWDRPDWDRPHRPRYPDWDRPRPRPHYPNHSGGSVCINGPNGYFCIGS